MSEENELLGKFRDLLKISQRVKKSDVAAYLGLTESALFPYLVKWGHLGFKIDNDLIVVENLSLLISELDSQFSVWEQRSIIKEGKCEASHGKEYMSNSLKLNRNEEIAQESGKKSEFRGIQLVASEAIVLTNMESQLWSYIFPAEDLTMKKRENWSFFAENGHVIGLNLSFQPNSSQMPKLTVFPEEITQFQFLRVLDLSNNAIPTIPSIISSLKSLEIIRLDGNPKIQTSVSFWAFPRLQELSGANFDKITKGKYEYFQYLRKGSLLKLRTAPNMEKMKRFWAKYPQLPPFEKAEDLIKRFPHITLEEIDQYVQKIPPPWDPSWRDKDELGRIFYSFYQDKEFCQFILQYARENQCLFW